MHSFTFSCLSRIFRGIVLGGSMPVLHMAYLVLAFIAAAVFPTGLFALIVVFNIAFDCHKYASMQQLPHWRKIEGIIRENVLDAALIVLALVTSVYLSPALPTIAGLHGLARAHIELVRGLSIVLPRFTVLIHAFRTLCQMGVHESCPQPHPSVGKPMSLLEGTAFATLIVALSLTVFSPQILKIHPESVTGIVSHELRIQKL